MKQAAGFADYVKANKLRPIGKVEGATEDVYRYERFNKKRGVTEYIDLQKDTNKIVSYGERKK